jgi:hypothetical protein
MNSNFFVGNLNLGCLIHMHTLANSSAEHRAAGSSEQQQPPSASSLLHHHHHHQHIPQVVFTNVNLVNTASYHHHDDTKTFDDVVFDILKVDPDDIAVFYTFSIFSFSYSFY